MEGMDTRVNIFHVLYLENAIAVCARSIARCLAPRDNDKRHGRKQKRASDDDNDDDHQSHRTRLSTSFARRLMRTRSASHRNIVQKYVSQYIPQFCHAFDNYIFQISVTWTGVSEENGEHPTVGTNELSMLYMLIGKHSLSRFWSHINKRSFSSANSFER